MPKKSLVVMSLKDAGFLDGDLDLIDKAFICAAVNHYGGASHPYAEPDNVGYFMVPYTINCLRKAARDCKKCGITRVEVRGRYAELLAVHLEANYESRLAPKKG